MGSMPGYNVSKGPFAILDGTFDGTNPAAYTNALAMLTGSLAAAATARFGAGNVLVTHFQTHWLNNDNNSNHWKHLQPDDTLKAGLSAAIAKARSVDPAHPKPMEFFWVCADEDEFNVFYSDGPHQVTVIILTPPPLDDHGKRKDAFVKVAELSHPENLWVVKPEDTYETTVPGNGYPGLVTELTAAPPAAPARIIERQIYSD